MMFPCKSCSKEFVSPSKLSDHMRAVHFKIRLKCTECDKDFSSKSSMRIHIKRTFWSYD